MVFSARAVKLVGTVATILDAIAMCTAVDALAVSAFELRGGASGVVAVVFVASVVAFLDEVTPM